MTPAQLVTAALFRCDAYGLQQALGSDRFSELTDGIIFWCLADLLIADVDKRDFYFTNIRARNGHGDRTSAKNKT